MGSFDVRRAVACVLLAAAAGCDRAPADQAGMSTARFVAANVALRALGEGADSTRRAQVLDRYRVTEDDLRAWVRTHAREPETLAAAWERIAHQTDSLATQRPAPPAEGEPIIRDAADVEPALPGVRADSLVTLPEPPRPRPRQAPPVKRAAPDVQ